MDFGIKTLSTIKMFNKETGEEVMSIDYNNPKTGAMNEFESNNVAIAREENHFTIILQEELNEEQVECLLKNNKEFKLTVNSEERGSNIEIPKCRVISAEKDKVNFSTLSASN